MKNSKTAQALKILIVKTVQHQKTKQKEAFASFLIAANLGKSYEASYYSCYQHCIYFGDIYCTEYYFRKWRNQVFVGLCLVITSRG